MAGERRESHHQWGRSMQLHYIPVAASSLTDLFLDRISLE